MEVFMPKSFCGDLSTSTVKDEAGISMTLEDAELWSKFEGINNEMILTKNGRRMFPVIKIRLNGLEPSALYTLGLEFKQIDQKRWKFINGEWLKGCKAEPAPQNPIYTHPDSPNYGSFWLREPISFAKVKLTNKVSGKGQILLNSLHKYEPRVHIMKVESGLEANLLRRVKSFELTSTQFIAVTAYQNKDVTSLKIKHNPFAKAFLEKPKVSGVLQDSQVPLENHGNFQEMERLGSMTALKQQSPWHQEVYNQMNKINQGTFPQNFQTSTHQSPLYNEPWQEHVLNEWDLPNAVTNTGPAMFGSSGCENQWGNSQASYYPVSTNPTSYGMLSNTPAYNSHTSVDCTSNFNCQSFGNNGDFYCPNFQQDSTQEHTF